MYVENHGKGNIWLTGTVVQLEGWMVQVEDGQASQRPRFPKQKFLNCQQEMVLSLWKLLHLRCQADTGDLSRNSESDNETHETVDQSANVNSRPVQNHQPSTRCDNSDIELGEGT